MGVIKMMAKKFFLIAIAICVVFILFPVMIFADDYTIVLPKDMDEEQIVKSIVSFINSFSDTIERKISEDDVDLSKAFKIYIGTNIFKEDTNNYYEILSILESGEYIFEVPVRVGDDTYVANIQRLNPMPDYANELFSPEELDEYEKKVGTWDVTAVYEYLSDSPFISYYETAQKISGIVDYQPILVGTLPCIRFAVALYPDDTGNIGKLILTNPAAVSWDDLGLNRFEYQNKALDYTAIKDRALKVPSVDNELSGGNNSVIQNTQLKGLSGIQFFLGLVFILFVVGSVLIIKKKQLNHDK